MAVDAINASGMCRVWLFAYFSIRPVAVLEIISLNLHDFQLLQAVLDLPQLSLVRRAKIKLHDGNGTQRDVLESDAPKRIDCLRIVFQGFNEDVRITQYHRSVSIPGLFPDLIQSDVSVLPQAEKVCQTAFSFTCSPPGCFFRVGFDFDERQLPQQIQNNTGLIVILYIDTQLTHRPSP
jgi:hypothetical protein